MRRNRKKKGMNGRWKSHRVIGEKKEKRGKYGGEDSLRERRDWNTTSREKKREIRRREKIRKEEKDCIVC